MRSSELALLGCLVAHLCTGATARAEPEGCVVLFVVDYLSWEDVTRFRTPNLGRLIRDGALGNVSMRPARGGGVGRSALSIGAGRHASLPGSQDDLVGEVLGADEHYAREDALAGQVFARRIGVEALAGGAVAVNFPWLQVLNLSGARRVTMGALGQTLREAGLKAGAVGCADVTRQASAAPYERFSVAIAVDRVGRVDSARIGRDLLEQCRTAPFGVRCRHDRFLAALKGMLGVCSVVIADTGDRYRAELYSRRATPKQAARMRRDAMERTDAALGELAARLDPARDLLMVFPLALPRLQEQQLAPLIVWGRGVPAGSWVTSPSTRRPGLVASTDLAPTALGFLRLRPPETVVGREITYVATDRDRLVSARRLSALTERVDGALRTPLLLLLAILQTGLIVWLTRTVRRGGQLGLPLQALCAAVFSLPLCLYAVTPVAAASAGGGAAAALVGALVLGGATVLVLPNAGAQLAFLSALTAGVIAADVCTGARLALGSVLAYSPAVGARYYGIGNEPMGVLLGAVLLRLGLLHGSAGPSTSRARLAATLALLVGVTAVIALPFLGANFGGTLTSGCAVTVWGALAFRRGRPGHGVVRTLGLVAVGTGLAVALMLSVETLLGASGSTHFGRFVAAVRAGGAETLLGTLWLKAQILVASLRHAHWVAAVATCAASAWLLWRWHRPWLPEWHARVERYRPTLVSSAVAAAVGSAVNDSGLVVAAMVLVFGYGGTLYATIDDPTRTPPGTRSHPADSPDPLRRRPSPTA
jgi:hypothetical protein